MEKIKVNKLSLREILEVNKKKHIEEYDKALEGYKIIVKKALSKKAKELKEATPESIKRFNLDFYSITKPESHEDDFDTVLGMLEVSTDDEIYITAAEYKQYYLNEWSWKNNWYSTNFSNMTVGVSNPASKYYVDGKEQ